MWRARLYPEDRDRYHAEALWRVPVGHVSAPDILALTVIELPRDGLDRGGRVRQRGGRISITADATATPAYVQRLLKDARAIFGIATQQMGRGPGAIRDDDQIRRVVSAMRQGHIVEITAATIAAYSGQFTRDNLRYYLTSRGQKLRDYL